MVGTGPGDRGLPANEEIVQNTLTDPAERVAQFVREKR